MSSEVSASSQTSDSQSGRQASGSRCIALVGPFGSGKTTLLEAILDRTGAITRQGTVAAGTTVGDGAPEARAHTMSVEMNIAEIHYLDDDITFLDCPGSVEFPADTASALLGADMAVVVCEADEKKIPALQAILKQLEDAGVPHVLYLNKIDKLERPVREVLELLQTASQVPLVLRQIPIWKDGIATGYIDLALERSFVFHEHAESEMVSMSDADQTREEDARYTMLETLADHDDALMEDLLEDIPPKRDLVFDDLAREMREGLICPVFIGAAESGNGVRRLLKAIRHEAPGIEDTRTRLGVTGDAPLAQVVRTIHTSHGGKLSVARVLSGGFSEGDTVTTDSGEEARISGVFKIFGQQASKRGAAGIGDVVAFGKAGNVQTGGRLAIGATPPPATALSLPTPVMALSVASVHHKDEVKLSAGLTRLIEEDPALAIEQRQDTGETLLSGQGEMHLRVALERLSGKHGLEVLSSAAKVPYRETIQGSTTLRRRHKKQSGGHGQFGDVELKIAPLPRGSGIVFDEQISGGVVPRQFIHSVEAGVREALTTGPLGFPVVDLAVTLTDGSHHSVDSSDQAFRMAAQMTVREGLPECKPVLLEPVMKVTVVCPSEATAKINAILSSRRGQIAGFDARPGWAGWDQVEALLPEAELDGLIVEVRSATAGVGSYTSTFDHLAELTGKQADAVLEAHKQNAA